MAWTVGTTRRTRDVYLTARPLGGTWKMSLHESGHWHSGFTSELAVPVVTPIPEHDRWQLPEDFAPGVRRSVELVFPDVELRHWPAGVTDNKPVTRIPAPGDGYAACVEVLFMDPGPPLQVEIDDAFNVALIELQDRTRLWIVARRTPWVAEDFAWLLVAKKALLARVDPPVLAAARVPRAILIGKHADGRRFAVDHAADL